jgi:hypothetical protein
VTDCRRSGDAAFDALIVAIFDQLPAVGARAGEPGVQVALRARGAEVDVMRQRADSVRQQWLASGESDFSIYQHRDYIADVYICWACISSKNVTNLHRWLLQHERDARALTIFDDYNGLGLTSLFFAQHGYRVAYFNDVPSQIRAMERCCDRFKIPASRLDETRSGRYDVVMSFEVAEHHLEPETYVRMLMRMAPRYLVMTTGFKEVYAGHFPEYRVGGRMVPIRQVGRLVNQFIAEEFDLVYQGYNGNVDVDHASIEAEFAVLNGRPMRVPFGISENSCNLKESPEHLVIKECLRRSGIIRV